MTKNYDITDEHFKKVVKIALYKYIQILNEEEDDIYLKEQLENCFAREGFDMYKLFEFGR